MEINYSDIADAMIKQYNPPYRKAALLSKLDNIRFSIFKQIHGIDNNRVTINSAIKVFDHLVPQLAADFQNEAQKTRFLTNGVSGPELSITSRKSKSASGYTYNQFVTALNESLQVQMNLNIFRGINTRYGHLIAYPKDVRR